MKAWRLVFPMLLLSSGLWGQEQLALKVNEQGLMKILELAVAYSSSRVGDKSISIPDDTYKIVIKKEKLLSNPFIPILNEISNLDFTKDLEFYFDTSQIDVNGIIDSKSLKAQILNSSENGFDLQVSVSIPMIKAIATKLSLCESKNEKKKGCGPGLTATLSGLEITTKGRPISLVIVLRFKTENNVARVKIVSLKSNIEGSDAPKLDINLKSIKVPPVSIIINGHETQLDTSRLKNEILKKKKFLAEKMLGFAADFIASDLAKVVNGYLSHRELTTSMDIYSRDESFLYIRPSLERPVNNPMYQIMKQMADIIRQARVRIGLKNISTPENKDLELHGFVDFILNRHSMSVGELLGNSLRPLPEIDLHKYRNNDVNLAISEPLLNGALELVQSTGLFQEVFNEVAHFEGVTIKNVKIHFTGRQRVALVVNVAIDLKKLESSGIKSWVKNRIGAFLERNNNDSVIYFPLQIEVTPTFVILPNGSAGMDLYIHSPFKEENRLINSFNYPTNIPLMTDTVKNAVLESLKLPLQEHLNKSYSIDLGRFLNQSGVVFIPKSISIENAAYLLLNLDIDAKNFQIPHASTPSMRSCR